LSESEFVNFCNGLTFQAKVNLSTLTSAKKSIHTNLNKNIVTGNSKEKEVDSLTSVKKR